MTEGETEEAALKAAEDVVAAILDADIDRGKLNKSYELQDELSSAWMDLEPVTFEEEEEEEEVNANEIVVIGSPEKSVERGLEAKEEKEEKTVDLKAKKSYELQDNLSSAWMNVEAMSFDSENEDNEKNKEKGEIKRRISSTSSVRNEDADVEQRENKGPDEDSKEEVDEKLESIVQAALDEKISTPSSSARKSYELQDEMSSAWMEAGPMTFESEDEEEQNTDTHKEEPQNTDAHKEEPQTLIVKELAASDTVHEIKVDQEDKRKSYELQDELSSAWMEAGPMSFESEDEEQTLDRNKVKGKSDHQEDKEQTPRVRDEMKVKEEIEVKEKEDKRKSYGLQDELSSA